MGLLAKDDVLIVLMKFGDLAWMDAPYTPHLSRNLTHLPERALPGEGLAVHLLLFDTATGALKLQRFFSAREQFSNELIREPRRLKEKSFHEAAYRAEIAKAYRFSTEDLVGQTRTIYRVQ